MSDGGAVARETGLYGTLEDLAGKIEQAVGPKGRAKLASVERCFLSWDKHAYRRTPREHLWPLVKAIKERRICRVAYRAASNRGVERRVRSCRSGCSYTTAPSTFSASLPGAAVSAR
jgi:hypothetical protein